jgi:hypothetical protein
MGIFKEFCPHPLKGSHPGSFSLTKIFKGKSRLLIMTGAKITFIK